MSKDFTSSFHALGSCVNSMRQGADDAELGKQGDALRTLEFGGWPGQVGTNPGEGDLGRIRLEHDQVTLQLSERETALLTETPAETNMSDHLL